MAVAVYALILIRQNLSAKAILSKSIAAYKQVTSYGDSVIGFDPWSDPPGTVFAKVAIRFTRSDGVRMSFRDLQDGYTVRITESRSHKQVIRISSSRKTNVSKSEQKGRVTASWPFEIVNLLQGSQPFFLNYKEWTESKKEVVGKRECYRFDLNQITWSAKVWIDTKTYLILRAQYIVPRRAAANEVYYFHPEAG